MIIFGSVKGQCLAIKQSLIASGTVNYITADFKFSSEWNGLLKIVNFHGEVDGKVRVFRVELKDNHITQDQGVNLPSGTWRINIVGYNIVDGEMVQRITTAETSIVVTETHLCSEPFPEFTPSFGETVLAKSEEAIRIAQSVREDADNGKFTPQKGVDYWTSKDREEIIQDVRDDLDEAVRVANSAKQEVSDLVDESVKARDEAVSAAEDSAESARKSEISAKAAQAAVNQMNYVTFELNREGDLIMNNSERLGTTNFSLNDEGDLEVEI